MVAVKCLSLLGAKVSWEVFQVTDSVDPKRDSSMNGGMSPMRYVPNVTGISYDWAAEPRAA
jgi:hypothetical protein